MPINSAYSMYNACRPYVLLMSTTNLAKNALVKITEMYVLAEISKIAVTPLPYCHFCCYRLRNVHVEYVLYRALVIIVYMCIHVHNKCMKYVSSSYPAHACGCPGPLTPILTPTPYPSPNPRTT